jgi:hypothetical protein
MSVVTAHRRVETPHARCLRLVRPPLRSGERELKGTFVVGRAVQRVVWATGRSAAAADSAHRLHVCPPRVFVGGSDGRGELSIPTRLATSFPFEAMRGTKGTRSIRVSSARGTGGCSTASTRT